ncbi:MAG: hypothetical protein ACFE0P_16245 [Oceanicaulis sp.]
MAPLVLAAALAIPDAHEQERRLEAALDTVRAAWASGTAVEARDAAAEAFRLMESDRCAVSADAARLAYAAGLAGLKCSDERLTYGYHLWAALRIDDAAGGLTESERRIAETFASEPGVSPRIDYLFVRSAYLSERLEAAPGCPARFETPVPPATDASGEFVIIIDRGSENRASLADHQLLAAWPSEPGTAFSELLRRYSLNESGYSHHGEVLRISSTRCEIFIEDATGTHMRICGLDHVEPIDLQR